MKHKLKFQRVGVHFIGFEGLPYVRTWDFRCTECGETVQVDRVGWRNRLLGRRGVPVWTIRDGGSLCRRFN